MDGGTAEVGTVPRLQGGHELGKIQPLVYLDQQMVRINEIPQAFGVNWKRVESLRQRSSGSSIAFPSPMMDCDQF